MLSIAPIYPRLRNVFHVRIVPKFSCVLQFFDITKSEVSQISNPESFFNSNANLYVGTFGQHLKLWPPTVKTSDICNTSII